MSKIEKLSVSGVRSFSPLSRETIAFNTPLTLIVGYNGSGKTTIIECLKYATTGEFPPNSKGGAFIHDPKLCGEREVMAQVKLKFSTPPDTSYVVTRNIQLTVKKTTRTMKSLEGSLMTLRHGEKNTMSSKVAELDSSVPKIIGVAPAILETVIFCHQDESLWPMSEPGTLKKKFDEIFEAQKYIKAIDNLKTLRKKLGESLQKHKGDEAHEKVMKEKAEKTEKRAVALQDEIEDLRSKCAEMTTQMDAAQRNAKVKHEQANSFLGIVNELDSKQDLLAYRQEAIQELKDNMEELDESDDWLQETLQQYEERVARYGAELEDNKTQYAERQRELGKTRRDHAEQLAERGKHQSDKEKYEHQLQSRVETIQQAARVHSIRGFEGDLDDSLVKQFNERIQKLLGDKKRELDHLQRENAEEVDKKTSKITELESRKASKTQDRVFAKQRIGALEKRINSAQNELNKVDVDEGSKAVLDASLQDLEGRLRKAIDDFQTADLDAKVRQESDELSRLEAESDRLGLELMECMKMAKDRAQLDLRQQELHDKKRNLNTLTNSWSDKMSSMISGSWAPNTLEREFHVALQARTKALEEETHKRDEAVQSLKQVQFALSNARENAKKRDAELERCKLAVLKALKEIKPDQTPNMDSLPEEIERIEEDILQYEKDISLYEKMADYYKKCQTTLNKSNKCRLCDHIFADLGEKSRVAKKLKEALNGEEEQRVRDDLVIAEEEVGKLRAVRPKFDTYRRLSSEKPEVDVEIQAAKEKEDTLLRQLDVLDDVVKVKQEERYDLDSMSKTVSSISQLHHEIEESQAQVDRIESQQRASGAARGSDEVKDAQTACSERMRSVKNKITKHQNDKQRMRDLMSSLELEKSQLNNKISTAAQQLEMKKNHLSQIQAYRDDVSQQKEIIQQADQELEAVEPQIAKARTIRDDTLSRGRAKEKKVADDRDDLAASVNELKLVESDIRAYLERGGPSNLVTNERAIQALNKTITRIEKDMNELAASTNRLKDEISNSARRKKNIQDNLNYRKNLRQVDSLKHDIAELESRNATEDYERNLAQAKAFESMRDKLNAERGSMMGAMKTKDEELAHNLEEWKTDYQGAARKYREAHVKVETTKAAIEDLGQYGAALDKAIMQYHSLKMEEVNRIAGELWTKTYQGTDIDNIMIRADAESSTTARKTYNYRVCMVKQDTEMDMRGRCSAGQRVLASIIIRLALAESFGVNCGLIALDEPTTNLDRDNIRSLATSLHEIIKTRQAQSNFQLIVITHDEEFLRHMKCSDFCDSFYRVKRDEKQNSIIQRESISKVV